MLTFKEDVIGKLGKCVLGKWTVSLVKSWQNDRAQRVVISGAVWLEASSWRHLQGSELGPISSISLISGWTKGQVDCQQICFADHGRMGGVIWSEAWTDWRAEQGAT